MDTRELGRWGEDLAAQHIDALGWTLLARNWRCPQGELDLVAQEPDGTVVFLEVKTRSGTGFGGPVEAVDRRKAGKLRQLAGLYLMQGRPTGAGELRFDVVGIVWRAGHAPEMTHLRGCF